jgi:hypothetical protein
LPSISLNRSLKSELTNIDTLYLARVQNQLPCSIEASRDGLGLPKLQIERAIQVFDAASAFDEVGSYCRLCSMGVTMPEAICCLARRAATANCGWLHLKSSSQRSSSCRSSIASCTVSAGSFNVAPR